MVIPTTILMEIIIRRPLIFNLILKNLLLQKNFNALLEEKLPRIDELARNMDRISLDVDSLKLRCIPPKHDIMSISRP